LACLHPANAVASTNDQGIADQGAVSCHGAHQNCELPALHGETCGAIKGQTGNPSILHLSMLSPLVGGKEIQFDIT
jgi:hypothetical protein